jgi:hypothetical protein
MGYGAEYTPFCTSPQHSFSEIYCPATTFGGPVGLPSVGAPGGTGTVIGPFGAGPVGASFRAIRLAGTEIVARSVATANQRRLIFTV